MSANDGDVETGGPLIILLVSYLSPLEQLHDLQVPMVDGIVEAIEALCVLGIELLF